MITVRFHKGQQKSKLAKRAFKIAAWFARVGRLRLIVSDGATDFVFYPKNLTEYYRAITFFSKEKGTLAWLNNSLGSGEVFFDIGANIGLYSLYAAKLGRGVKVYAFEPHKFTFVNLMENIACNDAFADIAPIAIPLSDVTDISSMNYVDMESGSSMSQLGHTMHPDRGAFKPQLAETVYCTTLDELIWKKALPAPHHIKIDVDGNEPKILAGMAKLLSSTGKPKTIQVEINPGQKAEVDALILPHGYRIDHVHHTAGGAQRIEQGESADTIAYNVVYVRE